MCAISFFSFSIEACLLRDISVQSPSPFFLIRQITEMCLLLFWVLVLLGGNQPWLWVERRVWFRVCQHWLVRNSRWGGVQARSQSPENTREHSHGNIVIIGLSTKCRSQWQLQKGNPHPAPFVCDLVGTTKPLSFHVTPLCAEEARSVPGCPVKHSCRSQICHSFQCMGSVHCGNWSKMSSTSCQESLHIEWNHGVPQWFGLEGGLKIIQFQPPSH